MRPDLGEVERIVGGVLRLFLRHDLDLHLPAREFATLDAAEQSFLIAFAGLADKGFAFLVGEVVVALLGLEVELHPVALACVVPEGIGVRTVAVHVHRIDRQAAVRHQDRDLVQAFRRQRPEVPHGGRGAKVGARMTLLSMDEVRELQWVTDEEDRRIIADEIPVAVRRVELQRKAANVALVVGGAHFTGNGGESSEHRRFRAWLQTFRLGVLGDVAGDLQRTICAPALGVHDALRDALAVLVGQLLDQLVVLQHDAAARPRRHRVLVIRYRRTGRGRHRRTIGHGHLPG